MYKTLTLAMGFSFALPSGATSLATVAEAALANHPQVQIAELAMRMDQQQSLVQRSAFAPQVGLSGSIGMYVQSDTSVENLQYLSNIAQLTVSQKLFDANARATQSSLDLTIDKSRFEVRETEGMVLLDVSERYIQASMAIDKMNLQQQEERHNEKLLKSAKHKYQLQEAYITDVHMAQANYDLAVSDAIVAATEVGASLANLSEITGVKIELFEPKNQLISIAKERDLEYWLTQATVSNYSIQAAQVASIGARKTLESHAYANFPVIDAKFVVKSQGNRGGSHIAPRSSNYSFVISLNMPLYQGGRVAAQRQYSKDNYAIALHEQKKIEQALMNRVTAQYLRQQAMKQRIEAIARALVSTQKATQTIRTGLDYGVSTQAQLLASTKQEFQLQLQLKQAKYQATLSWIQLKQMAGQLTIEYLNGLSKQAIGSGGDV
jgi:outer membrane protein